MKNNKKILIITHPGFKIGIQNVARSLNEFTIDVYSFKDKEWRNRSIFSRFSLVRKYNIVHFFWGYAKIFDFIIYRLLGNSKIINHFIGTDLYNIIKRSFLKRTELKLCSYLSNFSCVSSILSEDLRKINIQSSILPFVNQNIKKRNLNYPLENRIMVYLPSERKKFFKHDMLLKLAKEMKDINFTWFPYKKDPNEILPDNISTIERIERENMFNTFNEHKIFIRIPEHDGLPNTILEALSMGRWVIWSYEMNNVTKVNNYDELYQSVKFMIENPNPNVEGADFVINNYSFKHICELFNKNYRELLI
ncbi:MAG: hypothetical protein PF638_06780 [Candidatus Delongbacteria bacterium]|nr:hypothetical protein [Candidatus Delongbacteria bacterium]